LQYADRRAAGDQQYVRGKRDQFRSILAIKLVVAGTPAILDLQVAARCLAPFFEPIQEGRNFFC
jgi:hypothetical protein